ncbi:lactate utilization protein C [Bacterioplanoides sp. SCSIO 12839]|uniref:LutC/YkgG family protein n=1 Tax=Bacterioplanoides sp. SCSIO 12839 TaxID=2829569 RepID=UPI002104E514|nr:lactate utilization protein C [Bacterioplanoides sp. SCSIO 12839]UTW47368.1 lactate utilization protein C [Bacterioplanoides sp. SCSIO 12839]
MSSRDRILQRLKNAQAATPVSPSPLAFAATETRLKPAEYKSEFVQNLVDNHAEVIEISSQDLASTVQTLLADKQLERCLIGQNVEAAELNKALPQLEVYEQALDKEVLFQQVNAGICWAQYGLAETGSLMLETSVQQPRTLSLVPPVNIVVVRESDLLADFNQLVGSEYWQQKMAGETKPTNLLLVSGPSKTADIQQTLAFGAHGPKELVVILISE